MPMLGERIRLNLQLWDGAENKYVRAYLYDDSGDEIATVNMTHVGNGLYSDSSVVMPFTNQVRAVYRIFSNSSYSFSSTRHAHAMEVFPLELSAVGSGGIDLIGLIDYVSGPLGGDNCGHGMNRHGWQGKGMPKILSIIRGTDREFVFKLLTKETNDPFDLTGASQIKVFFPKEDGSVLEKTMIPSGSVSIINAAHGKVRVMLDEIETASLNVGEAQSFEVEIQIGSITSIVQFFESLNVIDRVFHSSF